MVLPNLCVRSSRVFRPAYSAVVPAKAGTEYSQARIWGAMGPRFRGRDTPSLVETARRFWQIIAQRIEVVGLVQETFDRRARDHRIGRSEQYRLAQLMVPRPDADGEPFVAVEASLAQDELALGFEIGRACA